jgi:two-component system cell cycle response regulator
VILMDLQMPNLNGYDAAAQIKALPDLRHVPIVAVTAFAMVGDRDKILAGGFNGYIPKPITPETFVAQVETFVSKSAPAAPRRAPFGVRANGKGHTILVVDNSPVNLSLAASTFEPFGYEVVVAHSVAEALDLARRRRPDLILSDVHMPSQSGYDFLRIVKEDETLKTIPFVFISSTVWGNKERDAGLDLGADRFILRPIEPEALIKQVDECLADTKDPEAPDGDDSRRR